MYVCIYIYTYIYIGLTRKSPDTRNAYVKVGLTPDLASYCNIMHEYTYTYLLDKGGIV